MYKISISPEEIEKLEPASFPGKIKVIDSLGLEYLKAVRYLKKQKIVGFDTESRPSFSPGQPHYGVSLLQLSGAERAFLFRIKLIGDIPRALRSVLSDERILKVGAAVNDDVRGLEKHHNFVPKGFVDLQKIVWEYGDPYLQDPAVVQLGGRDFVRGAAGLCCDRRLGLQADVHQASFFGEESAYSGTDAPQST